MANLPVPVPRTFSVSETETGSYLNTVRDALNFLLNPPEAVLKQATIQSIPNGALTSISLDASVNDSYGGHSNVTNNSRYTAVVTGWYWVSGVVGFASNGTGQRVADFAVNGADLIYTQVWIPAITGAPTAVSPKSELVLLNAGDYVELRGYQTSGGALNTMVSGPQSSLSVDFRHA